MYKIDYVQGHFGISLEGFIEDREEFNSLINYLKFLYIQYNPKTKLWGFENERIDEILLWFKKDNKEYIITDEALQAISEINDFYSKREIQYFRERKYYEGLLNSNFRIIPEQIDAINWCLKRNVYLNASDTGCGKAQPLYSKILTPSGWSTMGEIKEGEYVIGSDGEAKKVIGTFPQGKKDIYRITFSDKSSVECCDEHLWSYFTHNDDARGGSLRTASLKSIMKEGIKTPNGSRKMRLPNLSKPIEFSHKDLPIHPYVLGILIAEGCIISSVSFSTPDEFIVDKMTTLIKNECLVTKKGKYDYCITRKVNAHGIKNIIKEHLKDLGLFGKHSYEKSVPDIYKYNSFENRLQLINGLFDGDGCAEKGNSITYCTTSKQLAEDVQFLIQSIGGLCTVRERKKFFTHKGIRKQGRLAYCLYIRQPDNIPIFSLPKKLERCSNKEKYKPKRYFNNIEYVGKQEAKCILIDSPDHLYVTDNCILTHNTAIEIAHIMYLFNHNICDKFIIVVPIGTGFNWEYQFKEFTNLSDNDFGHITNENKDKPFSKLKDKKIILISNNTLASVISSYKESKTKSKSLKNFRWKNLEIDLKKELDCKNGLGIVVDESHFFKKTSSIKTKALKAIKYQFDYRFYLSATPNINKFEHIYSQINDLDKSIIPMSENAFKMDIAYSIGNRFDRYAINRYNPNKVDYYRNKLKTIIIQLMKSDIKSFKYQKYITPLYNKLHPLQRQMYQRVCEIEINKLQEEFDTITWQLILNKFPMLLTVIDCPSVVKKSVYDDDTLNGLLDKWKLDYDPKFIQLCSKLENYIEEQDEKVLVFDPSPHVLDLLYTQFEKYNSLIIHGSLVDEKDKEKERAEKVNLFNNEKKHKLFLLSTHTSSGSLNLQKDCHRSIVYSCPQDATELRQLQDRTFRITSESDTNVDIMTYPETIDNIRYNRAVNRLELNDKLTKEITQEELNKLLGGII